MIFNGGKYYITESDAILKLDDTQFTMRDKNIKFNFNIYNGYFENEEDFGTLLLLEGADTNGIDVSFNFKILTFRSENGKIISGDIVEREHTIDNTVPTTSKLMITNLDTNEKTEVERTVSIVGDFTSIGDYDAIEILEPQGFSVADIELTDTYGYTTPNSSNISIYNYGTNSLQVKNVTVDSSNFIIEGNTQPTIATKETDNTSFTIKAKEGLEAGEYTATITVTDINNITYTSNIKLNINRKNIENLGINQESWMYGEVAPEITKYGVESLEETQYKIEYAVKNTDEWVEEKPQIPGEYTIRISLTDSNLVEQSAQSDFEIEKNNKEIKIVANSNSWTYDGTYHSDDGCKIYYDGTEITTGVLPTGDAITAVAEGSIRDVKETAEENNEISDFNVENEEYYTNIIKTNGKLEIIQLDDVITLKDIEKKYTGETYKTTGLAQGNWSNKVEGDELVLEFGYAEQTYAGSTNIPLKSKKVMRNGEDITSNYNLDVNGGVLRVTPADQYVDIKRTPTLGYNQIYTTSQILAALEPASDSIVLGDFSFSSTNNLAIYDEELYGGLRARDIMEGTAWLVVTVSEVDVNKDGIVDLKKTVNEISISVREKEEVEPTGITQNEEFTYDGTSKTPSGQLEVDGRSIPSEHFAITYKGTGDTEYNSSEAPKEVGTYEATYELNIFESRVTGKTTVQFTIKQIESEYTVPTNLNGTKGQKLSEIELPQGFTWNEPNTLLKAGQHTYMATYTPEDTKHYSTVTNIEITITAKDYFDITTKSGEGGTITESKTNILEGSKVKITFTANPGYMIEEVLVNEHQTEINGNELEILVDGNKTVEVKYKRIPVKIEVTTNEGEDVKQGETITIEYDEDGNCIIKPNPGYTIDKIIVDGVEKEDGENTLNPSEITVDTKVEIVVKKIEYKVTEGANQKYIKNKTEGAIFKIDANYELFKEGGKVYIDEILVGTNNYTSKSGSTIITLKQEYADTLAESEHTLKVIFANGGEAIAKFTVEKATTPPEEENTPGKDNNGTTSGGNDNTSGKEDNGTTSGGNDNTSGKEDNGTTSGGNDNTSGKDDNGTTSGGNDNTSGKEDGTTSGGNDNTSGKEDGTTSGGNDNTSGKEDGTTSGGNDNTSGKEDGTTSGGNDNTSEKEDGTTSSENNNTNTESKDTTSNPKTSDNIIIYINIALISLMGIVATAIVKNKKRK